MKKYHYVYQIINNNPIDQRKYYIGVRSSKVLPEQDINYNSSSNYLKHALKEIGHNNFTKEILSLWETRELANIEEIRLHALFDVAVNPEYYNKSKAVSKGFCTQGMVTVINLKTGEKEFVTIEDSKDKSKYRSLYEDIVCATDKITGKKVKVSKDEYKNNPNLVHNLKGTVTAIDIISGLRFQVTQEEFINNPSLVGQLTGKVNVIDKRTGKSCSVSREEYYSNDYYIHYSTNTINVIDIRDNKIKHIMLSDYYKYDYYIALQTKLVEVYDNNHNLIYSVLNGFKEFCQEKRLPSNAFSVSKQNGGKPLYENSGSNETRLKNQGYWQYKGWYAIDCINKIKK